MTIKELYEKSKAEGCENACLKLLCDCVGTDEADDVIEGCVLYEIEDANMLWCPDIGSAVMKLPDCLD